jgi:hypothetical protein
MKAKWSLKRKIAVSVFFVLSVMGILLYANFNKLVSEAVQYTFNSNIMSDVYELKFEKLRVNVFKGDVRVVNVVVKPREVWLKDYPYINSSLALSAEEITLVDVQLLELLRSGRIFLKEISVRRSDISLTISEAQPILFPFTDSATVESVGEKKKTFDAFMLTRFRLVDAAFHVSNSYKEREASVKDFNLSLDDLYISQKPDTNIFSFSKIDLAIGELKRMNKKGIFKHLALTDFKFGVDSLHMQSTRDTLTYRASEFRSALSNLDIHTADSLFHITVGSYSSSYRDGQIRFRDVSFTPNISREAMQARYKYQNVQVSGKFETLEFRGINYDSIIYYHTLLIDSVLVDKPELTVFKDKTKTIDSMRIPTYLGQQIAAVKLPLTIRNVLLSNVRLVNVERKPDSAYAQVSLERGYVSVRNITNRSKAAPLSLVADAHLSGKVHFNLRLDFSYKKPEFDFAGGIRKFDMPELNAVLKAYTPATISAGIADEMTFAGKAGWTSADGTMKFLYHDLEVELALKDQARWKSSLIAFAANTIVHTSNPGSANLPPREVKLHAERDMNKGFVNVIMKSLLNGVKETLIMSKENRAAYQAVRKQKKKDS